MLPMAYSTGLRKKGLSKRRGDLEPEIVFPLGGDIVCLSYLQGRLWTFASVDLSNRKRFPCLHSLI